MSRKSRTRLTGFQAAGDFDNRVFPHAEAQQIGLAIEQDGTTDLVAPIVVMRQPAKRRLDAAGDHRNALVGFAGALAVCQRRAVGPQANAAAGRVGIAVTDFAIGRVMVDHRIHVAGTDREEQSRLAEQTPGVATPPVGLADDRHAIPSRLEHSSQNRHRKTGMIDVRVAGDEHDVGLVPAPFAHLLDTHR